MAPSDILELRQVTKEYLGTAAVKDVDFSLRKGEISEPFPTIHGWHILQALSDTTPAKMGPLAKVAPAIRRALGARNQQQKIARFVDSTTREFCRGHKVTYEKPYTPAADPLLSLIHI